MYIVYIHQQRTTFVGFEHSNLILSKVSNGLWSGLFSGALFNEVKGSSGVEWKLWTRRGKRNKPLFWGYSVLLYDTLLYEGSCFLSLLLPQMRCYFSRSPWSMKGGREKDKRQTRDSLASGGRSFVSDESSSGRWYQCWPSQKLMISSSSFKNTYQ